MSPSVLDTLLQIGMVGLPIIAVVGITLLMTMSSGRDDVDAVEMKR